MTRKGWPRRREWLLLGLDCLVLLVLRYSGLAVHPWTRLVARALTALFLTLALGERPSFPVAALFSVAAPCLAWAIDLIDGDIAFVLGFSAFAFAWTLTLCPWRFPPLRALNSALLAALAAGAVSVLGMFLLLAVRKELTPGAAFLYTLPREIRPTLMYLAGAWAGLAVSGRRRKAG